MLRVVLDTNIFISALFWKGTPGRIIEAIAARKAHLVLSDEILNELARKISSRKFSVRLDRTGKTVQQVVGEFRQLAEITAPAIIPQNSVRDQKDQIILACAVGGHVDCIVSGDKDLTELRVYVGIPIFSPAQFLAVLDSRPMQE
jgi:putative PIN family toxin of toxin-antitoxin system